MVVSSHSPRPEGAQAPGEGALVVIPHLGCGTHRCSLHLACLSIRPLTCSYLPLVYAFYLSKTPCATPRPSLPSLNLYHPHSFRHRSDIRYPLSLHRLDYSYSSSQRQPALSRPVPPNGIRPVHSQTAYHPHNSRPRPWAKSPDISTTNPSAISAGHACPSATPQRASSQSAVSLSWTLTSPTRASDGSSESLRTHPTAAVSQNSESSSARSHPA